MNLIYEFYEKDNKEFPYSITIDEEDNTLNVKNENFDSLSETYTIIAGRYLSNLLLLIFKFFITIL